MIYARPQVSYQYVLVFRNNYLSHTGNKNTIDNSSIKMPFLKVTFEEIPDSLITFDTTTAPLSPACL